MPRMLLALVSSAFFLFAAAIAVAGEDQESQLRAVLSNLDAHWNGRNADKMSLLFTEDVDFRIYDRAHYKNREEFRQHYAKAFAKMSAGRRHATTMTSIRPITAELAVIDGQVTVSDEADPSYQIRHYHYTALAKRGQQGWQFAVFRVAEKRAE
jgi:uncharacterized protein (TIGR02246 family)